MGKRLDSLKGGRHEMVTKKFNERLVDGGMVCNKCKEVKKPKDYGSNKTYCLPCKRKNDKKRWKKANYKLW